MRNSTSTERSTLPTGGMRLRKGCRKGRLTAVSIGASGVCGLTQDKIASAKRVLSGYSGGDKSTAEYEKVGTGRTGHAESVQIVFDPKEALHRPILHDD